MLLNDDAPWRDELELTYENRENWVVKISTNVTKEDPDKPDIFLFGNHHAREWMSFSVPMYFLYVIDYSLRANANEPGYPRDNDGDGIENEDPFDGFDNDNDSADGATWNNIDDDCNGEVDDHIDEDWDEDWVVSLLDRYEIYVMPMVNPDGYEYDRTSFSEYPAWETSPTSGWRMNLRDNFMNGDVDRDQGCDGVDLNRNYPWGWDYIGVNAPVPCQTDVYAGPVDTENQDGDLLIDEDPWDGLDNDGDGLIDEDRNGGLSEQETRNVLTVVQNNDDDGDGRTDFVVSLSFHSFSELVLYPWGYTTDEVENVRDLEILKGMAAEMGARSNYVPMQAAELYPAAGDSDDALYGYYGIYSFTIEIGNQFHEHPSMIAPIARRNMGSIFYAIEISSNPADAAESLKFLHTPEIAAVIPPPAISAKDELQFAIEVNGTPAHTLFNYRIGHQSDISFTLADVRWEQWKSVSMKSAQFNNDTGRRVWTTSLPRQDALTQVEYYFEVQDYQTGYNLDPPAGKQAPHLLVVEFGETTWLEVGSGWAIAIMLFGIIYGGLFISLNKMFLAEAAKGFSKKKKGGR